MKKIVVSLILMFCFSFSFSQKTENLKIHWPEELKWKVGTNQEDETIHFIELVPGNETIDKWTIIGTMISLKGAQNIPMDTAMNMMFEQSKATAPKAKLTEIERDEKVKNNWILFKIEAPSFTDDPNPESQLFYIIQGNQSLYSNFVAIKNKELSKEFVDKWKTIFKASEILDHD